MEFYRHVTSCFISLSSVNNSRWLYDVCRGGDDEPVKERHIAQSVGCSKNFRGPTALDTRGKVKQWMECLAQELVDRLSKDKQMVGLLC